MLSKRVSCSLFLASLPGLAPAGALSHSPGLPGPAAQRAAGAQGVGPTLGPDVDSDADGLPDFQEVHKYRTDPQQADSDGDGIPDAHWEERREFSYTVRSRVRVLRPVDPLAACDDYQDARVLDEATPWIELEVIHYPLGTAGEAIRGDADWREGVDEARAYLRSTATSSWDASMRRTLLEELTRSGVDPAAVDDLTLANAAAERLMERSRFEDGFSTFYVDYRAGRPVVPPALEGVVERHERELGRSIEEQWERELFATGMFENRVHGSCTSSAIYLCGGLRAVGVPARIVLVIPIVDVNDPEQMRMVEQGIRHHGVRTTALAGLRRISAGWVSHTFNEVWIAGRWRRLNYTRMGQPILDEGLYGLTTHVLTVRDWADARVARTLGRRQGLGERDEVFRTPNPYATLEIDDRFGEHADVANPEVEQPERFDEVHIVGAAWLASGERPAHFELSGVDMDADRQHLILFAKTEGLTLERSFLERFWEAASKSFELVSATGEAVPAAAVRGWWWGKQDGERYLYYVLHLGTEARERLVRGAEYRLLATARSGTRFRVAEDLRVAVPD